MSTARRVPESIRSVMVVDNDPGVLTFMTMLFEKEGLRVSTAEDGLAALSLLETEQPDLMLVDLVMPNIGGDKLGRILRSQDRFSDTYLVMISAISPEENIDYRRFGFDACIAKGPFAKMGPIVLDVLAQLGTTITRTSPGGIYGLENLYKREITRELLSTKRHAELIIDNLSESILETNREGRIIFTNVAATGLFGIPEENFLSSNLPNLFSQEERPVVTDRITRAQPGRPPESLTVRYQDRIVTLQILAVDDDGVVSTIVIAQDVTDLKRSREELESLVTARTAELARANESLQQEIDNRIRFEGRLKASIREKEVMLNEIHHRVKNNLQLISSLLNLSFNRVEAGPSRDILQDTRRRIHSLALVHDKLYGAQDLALVDAQKYFQTLVEEVVQSLADDTRTLHVSVDARGVTLPIDIAVPCALIINELITNAIKHAFSGRNSGSLRVRLVEENDRLYILEVTDDGTGLPEGVSFDNPRSLGVRIVTVLVRQLDGTLEVASDGGTRIRLLIPRAAEEE